MNEYNIIAPFYTKLQKLVFGNALQQIQHVHLSTLNNNTEILIIGGGSGEILLEVLKHTPHSTIHYQEASSKMLAYTKAKLTQNQLNQVRFYHKTDLEYSQKFDTIITPFFLDLFEIDKLNQVLSSLTDLLKNDAVLIVADFYPSSKPLHKIIYLGMKLFFKLFTSLEAKNLYDFDKLIMKNLSIVSYRKFDSPAVFSAVYCKKS